MGVTVGSCALLASRPPYETVAYGYDVYGQPEALPFHAWNNIFFVGEAIAVLALAVEVAMAVVARGLLQGHYAFVKDPFNILDALVLAASVVEMALFALAGSVLPTCHCQSTSPACLAVRCSATATVPACLPGRQSGH